MVSCSTFADRLFGCSHYKEEDNYAKTIKLFIKKIIVEYKNSSNVGLADSFFSILVNEYKERSFAGTRLVYKEDREEFEDLCIKCAENLTLFFRNPITNLLDEYTYRSRINGYIGGQVEHNGVKYNVDFSMSDSKDTFYRLYYHRFNNYLYNVTNNSEYDMLVFMIPNDNYYLLKCDSKDYTIQRGMLAQTINRRTHRPGHQCITCTVTGCKPRFINNLGRLNGN